MLLNKTLTRGGRPLARRDGSLVMATIAAAPNAVDLAETLSRVPGDNNDATMVLTIPSLDPSYTLGVVVFRGLDALGVERSVAHSFIPAEGTVALGASADVMGVLAGADALYELTVTTSGGNRGFSVAPKPLAGAIPDEAAELLSVTIIGSGRIGEELSYSYTADGYPVPTVTAQSWMENDVEVGTSATYTPDGSVGDLITLALTIDNASGDPDTLVSASVTLSAAFSAPVVTDAAITGGSVIGVAKSATYTLAPGNPAAAASLQWKKNTVAIPGATGASYTPTAPTFVAGDDLTVTVSASNASGSSSDTSDIMDLTTTPADVAPVITAHTISGTGNAGATYTSVVTATGTPAPSIARTWEKDGVTISGATGATYTTPTNFDGILTCVAIATNTAGSSAAVETTGIDVNPVAPAQLTTGQWDIPTGVAKPLVNATTFGMDTLRTLEAVGATAVQWTTTATGTDDQLSWEDCVIGGLSGTWRIWTVGDAVGASGWNFKNFDPTNRAGDADRAGRVRIRYKTAANDLWSPSTAAKRVEPPVVVTPVSDLWQQVAFRSQAQANAFQLGGAGYQFARTWATSPAKPERVVLMLDVLPAWKTENFGDSWEPMTASGLWGGRSGESIGIDSQDGDRIIAISSMSTKRTQMSWNQLGGIYLSTDGGDTFTHRAIFLDAGGSGENSGGGTKKDSRFSRNVLCEASGGTPTTRTWYAIQRGLVANATAVTYNYVWESTNGGTSWTRGQALAPGTYGQDITFLLQKSNTGWYYLGGGQGGGGLRICKGNPSSAAWTALNVPGGDVLWADVGGPAGMVHVLTNSGLYRNTNNGEGAAGTWTQLISGTSWVSFAISPHDRDIILINGNSSVVPKRSLNGGTSWHTMSSNKYPGQPGGFEHQLWDTHSKFIFNHADPTLCICLAKQHFQRCTAVNDTNVTGGASVAAFEFGSSGFDCFDVQSAAMDPGNTASGDFLVNATDRLACMFRGAIYVQDSDDTWESSVTTGHIGGAGGCIWLRNGTNHAKIATALRSQSNVGGLVRFVTSGSNLIATGSVLVAGATTQGNAYAQHPTDQSKGLIGRWEVTLNANNTLTIVDCGSDVFGYDSAGQPFRVSGSIIQRRVAGVWTNFVTCITAPTPYDGGVNFAVDHNHAARLIYPTNNGRLRRVTGTGGTQVDVEIFDLRNYMTGVPAIGGGPGYTAAYDYRLFRCGIDLWQSGTRAAVTAYTYGAPNCIWITDDFTASTVVWTDITESRIRMGHQVSFQRDGTLFTGSLGGTAVYPRLGGAVAGDLYSRVADFNATIEQPA